MTKPKRRKLKQAMAVDTEPDAWDRFTKTVGKITPKKPKPKPEQDKQ